MTDRGCALVTGASRGIGAAIAGQLAGDGWAVGVNYRSSSDEAREVVDAIERDGGRALAVEGDVADAEAAERIFEALESRFGPVLVVVNNAGVREDGLCPTLSEDDWDRVLAVNLSSAFRITRRALRMMLRARYGRIVNVASVVGMRANAGQANYAAAKAGLVGFTRTVAVEVARRGITVNAVAPGVIATDMTGGLREDVASLIPARRVGTPAEVAACVGFLVSERASYITGSVITVDGGMAA